MIKIKSEHFNISQICASGQCFRMEMRENGRYSVIAGERYVEVKQCKEGAVFYFEEDLNKKECSKIWPGNICKEGEREPLEKETASWEMQEFCGFWRQYFDLETDYAAYMEMANPNDAYLMRAIAFGSGMRILRQDLWEMIVSFLISQQNNIVRIRRCIHNICEKYGEERRNFHGEVFYTFPKPEALAGLDENALMECNLGYRSKYVVRAARSVLSGEIDLEAVEGMPYKKAKAELLKLFGVGEKVADCICLFALHHLQAFPVDTHIQQALGAHYKRGFPHRRYGKFQGVIQQYIFYYELCGEKDGELKRVSRKIDEKQR
ncbi:DNA glycosylase [Roseburia hominis]